MITSHASNTERGFKVRGKVERWGRCLEYTDGGGSMSCLMIPCLKFTFLSNSQTADAEKSNYFSIHYDIMTEQPQLFVVLNLKELQTSSL